MPPPPFRKPVPAPYFHPLFKIFRFPIYRGGNQKLLPLFKKGGRSELCGTSMQTIKQ